MNKDELGGKWEQLKGKAKEKWGKLTDNDLKVISGKRDQLLGKIREHYGYTTEQAEKEYKSFMSECGECSTSLPKGRATTRPSAGM